MSNEGEVAGRPRLAIADVARAAGVSPMTVSRVLNDKPGVGDLTRARIKQMMSELGYRPNPTAVALKRGISRVVAYVSPFNELRGSIVDTLIGVERAAREAGWTVVMQSLDDLTPASVRSATDTLARNAVDVAIVVSPVDATSDALRELDAEVPAVGIWTPASALEPIAGPDVQRAAEAATEYLLRLGHKTVAHVSGPLGWMVTEHHRVGWERTLAAAGREIIPPVPTDWTPDDGRRAGLELLQDRRVTAVFAANDGLALGVMHAARDLGRRVPEDLSVIGYDDLPEAAHYAPALTTIAQDFADIGVRAFDAAMQRIGEPVGPKREFPRPRVRIRESTAAPRPAVDAD
jgi:DNA-binding LacI/PurR family transcriptional regulator